MYKIVSIADNDERQLIGELCLLQEVLYTLRGVAVGLAADPLNLLYLTGLTRSLDILEVNLWILGQTQNKQCEKKKRARIIKKMARNIYLTEVNNTAKEVEETLE